MEEKNSQNVTDCANGIKESEIWKDIDGYFGDYQISSHGRIKAKSKIRSHRSNSKSITKEIIMKLSPNSSGYLRACLTKNKKSIQGEPHRLVAIYFVENHENKPCVNHKDGNKSNNYYKNLEWCTWKENNMHALNNGLKPNTFGESNKRSKLTEEDVIEIRSIGKSIPTKELAVKFNVRPEAIRMVLANKTWGKNSFKRIKAA